MYDYEFHPQSVSLALHRVDYSALMFCSSLSPLLPAVAYLSELGGMLSDTLRKTRSWLTTVHALTRVIKQAAGVLTFDAADYHPEATTAFRAWMAETGRKVTYAGPLVPSSLTVETVAQESEAGDLLRFLDSQLVARGEKSVIFVRGSSRLHERLGIGSDRHG